MIEETGVVAAVSAGFAEVECERRIACGSCSAKRGCGTSLIERFFRRRRSVLVVHNRIGAQTGERVVVGVREDLLLKAALRAYLLPVVVMILTAAGAEWLSGLLFPGWQDVYSVIGGLAGLGAGLWLVASLPGSRAGDPGFEAVLLRRAQSPGVEVQAPVT